MGFAFRDNKALKKTKQLLCTINTTEGSWTRKLYIYKTVDDLYYLTGYFINSTNSITGPVIVSSEVPTEVKNGLGRLFGGGDIPIGIASSDNNNYGSLYVSDSNGNVYLENVIGNVTSNTTWIVSSIIPTI